MFLCYGQPCIAEITSSAPQSAVKTQYNAAVATLPGNAAFGQCHQSEDSPAQSVQMHNRQHGQCKYSVDFRLHPANRFGLDLLPIERRILRFCYQFLNISYWQSGDGSDTAAVSRPSFAPACADKQTDHCATRTVVPPAADRRPI